MVEEGGRVVPSESRVAHRGGFAERGLWLGIVLHEAGRDIR